jgi:NAD dependent epimerase/dehydratase family enzyme
MARPIKWGLGAPLATGKQMMSWIHIDDLCELFAKGITDSKMTGAYNGVAPHPVTNKELTVAMAKTLKKPLWLPNVPSFVLQLLVGEMGVIVVNGSNVSAKRVSETGFEFQYPKVESALSNLMRSS